MKRHLFKSLLTLALLFVYGNSWGDTYTIDFNKGTTSGTSISSSLATNVSTMCQSGAENVQSITGENCYYNAKGCGIRIASSKGNGQLNVVFCDIIQNIAVSEIIVYASAVTEESKLVVTTAGATAKNATYNNLSVYTSEKSDSKNYQLTAISINGKLESLSFAAYKSQYVHIHRIDIITSSSDPIIPTISATNMSCGVGENFDVRRMFSSDSNGAITYSVEDVDDDVYKLDGTIFSSEVAGTYTIKASQAADDDKYNAGEATAILTVLGKFTVNYYSLGVKIGTEEVYDGQSVANAPEVTNVPTGWSFIDWTTNDAYKQSATAPSFFDGVVTTDINLYAVFGKREGQISLTKMKADDSLSDGDNIVIVAHVDKADESGIKDYALYQETIKSSYVNKYPFVEDSEIIAADEKNWLTVNMKADGFSLGDKKNGYIYSVDNNLHCGETEQIWTISTTGKDQFKLQSDGRYLSYRYDLSNKYWRMGGAKYSTSGQTTLDIYKFVAGTYTYATIFPQYQNVTISNVGFATAYMGFDATVSGADAYYVTVGNGVANLTKVEGVIPANTGVVLEAQNGGAATATFTESVATADDKAAAEGNMLVGSIVGKTFDAEGYTYYILSKGTGEKADAVGFYWDKNSYNGTQARCGANKAILAVPTTGGAATSSISIRFDGATMIESIVETKSDVYYDLQGRKVENPSNGLYIVNGKKMLVK